MATARTRCSVFCEGSLVGLALLGVALTGCGANPAAPATRLVTPEAQVAGAVHGGQQPVSSATIQMYAVSTAADGGVATPLLTRAVQTGSAGGFSFGAADYSCPNASTPVYLTATGGNPGLAGSVNNSAIALMVSLGPCGGVAGLSSVAVNEVTTIGSLAAVFPFATGYAAIGSQSSDAGLFASALANIPVFTNMATGASPGPALPTGQYASSREIDALANSIASCINSTGGRANDGSACGSLFAMTTPAGGSAPTDVIGAVLNILKNPTQSVGGIFNLAQASPPFQPAIPSAPAKWVFPIVSTANPAITLAVSGASTVNLGNQTQYAATVSGTSNQAVTWQVNGVTGGNATYGAISPSGLYSPPAGVPAANALTITASSMASTTAAGSEAVTLLNPLPVVTAASGMTTSYGQSFVLDVQGTGFVNGASLLVNGAPVATTAVSLTDLQTTVTNTTGANLQILVAVANPAPGPTQSTSSTVTLTVPGATACGFSAIPRSDELRSHGGNDRARADGRTAGLTERAVQYAHNLVDAAAGSRHRVHLELPLHAVGLAEDCRDGQRSVAAADVDAAQRDLGGAEPR